MGRRNWRGTVRDIWLIAKHEYRRVVVRRGFVFALVVVPLGIAALIALAILVEKMGENNLPVGYVDRAGMLDVGHCGVNLMPALLFSLVAVETAGLFVNAA